MYVFMYLCMCDVCMMYACLPACMHFEVQASASEIPIMVGYLVACVTNGLKKSTAGNGSAPHHWVAR